jgi:glycosyltransferase involved in cell wall biosynthesis
MQNEAELGSAPGYQTPEKTVLAEARSDAPAPVAIIILTLNEEANIGVCLKSVCGWARQVFVLDSFSTDDTVAIARRFDCQVVQHAYSVEFAQRNWALDNLPIETEWIFYLDADEWMTTELKEEIEAVIRANPSENGFLLRWRFIWMGRWVKRGYYPKWLLRLVRRETARWEQREVNPHLIVTGPTGRLENDFIHDNQKGIADWTAKHIVYAKREAEQLLKRGTQSECLNARFWGTQSQRVRWLRLNVYDRLPPLVRPMLYFFYRLILRGGFLDGWRAIIYHFLHALWCPLLIDLFYLEMRADASDSRKLNGTIDSRTL